MEGGQIAFDLTILWQIVNLAILIALFYGIHKLVKFLVNLNKKQEEILKILQDKEK